MLKQADILNAIRSEREALIEQGWTRIEIGEALGVAKSAASRRIKEWYEQGRIKRGADRLVMTITGKKQWLPTYLFIDAREITAKDRGKEARKGAGAGNLLQRRVG